MSRHAPDEIPNELRIAIIASARVGMAPKEIHARLCPDLKLQRVHNLILTARRRGIEIPRHRRTGRKSPVADQRPEILRLAIAGNSPKVIVSKLQLTISAGAVSRFVAAARKAGAPIPQFNCYARWAA